MIGEVKYNFYNIKSYNLISRFFLSNNLEDVL